MPRVYFIHQFVVPSLDSHISEITAHISRFLHQTYSQIPLTIVPIPDFFTETSNLFTAISADVPHIPETLTYLRFEDCWTLVPILTV